MTIEKEHALVVSLVKSVMLYFKHFPQVFPSFSILHVFIQTEKDRHRNRKVRKMCQCSWFLLCLDVIEIEVGDPFIPET